MLSDLAGRTDTGRVRERNEDALLLRPERGLLAVADGMGGHAGGDIASRIAIDVLDEGTVSLGNDHAGQLEATIRSAHAAILKAAAADSALTGMGTTLTALHFRPHGGCLIAHVGDSRAYRLRGDSLILLTRDQTWVQRQLDAGMLSEDEAKDHPYSAVLTCALGVADIELDVQLVEPDCRPGDTFLLCSDGLTARLDDNHLRRILTTHADLRAAADALVDAANDAGGPDNITVALARPATDRPRPDNA
jgi:PPM family protein phosphatase